MSSEPKLPNVFQEVAAAAMIVLTDFARFEVEFFFFFFSQTKHKNTKHQILESS